MGWIYTYQTLWAGVLAIVAALVSVWGFWWHSNHQRQRRLDACRAMMPADLSEVAKYARQCAYISGTTLLDIRGGKKPEEFDVPELPERVFGNIQALIEHLDKRDVAAVSALLGSYQIQRARLADAIEDIHHPMKLGRFKVSGEDNIEFTFKETVRLQMIVNKLFDFARRQSEHVPPLKFTKGDLHNAINNLDIGDIMSDRTREALNGYVDA